MAPRTGTTRPQPDNRAVHDSRCLSRRAEIRRDVSAFRPSAATSSRPRRARRCRSPRCRRPASASREARRARPSLLLTTTKLPGAALARWSATTSGRSVATEIRDPRTDRSPRRCAARGGSHAAASSFPSAIACGCRSGSTWTNTSVAPVPESTCSPALPRCDDGSARRRWRRSGRRNRCRIFQIRTSPCVAHRAYTYPFSDMTTRHAHRRPRDAASRQPLAAVVCVNVAILVYATTATRQGEIGHPHRARREPPPDRHQLFVEALVLSAWRRGRSGESSVVALAQIARRCGPIAGDCLSGWTSVCLPARSLTCSARRRGGGDRRRGPGSRRRDGRVITDCRVCLRQRLQDANGARVDGAYRVQVAFAVAGSPHGLQAWQSIAFRTGDPGSPRMQFLTAEIVTEGVAPDSIRRDDCFGGSSGARVRRRQVRDYASRRGGRRRYRRGRRAVPENAVSTTSSRESKQGTWCASTGSTHAIFDGSTVRVLTGSGFRPEAMALSSTARSCSTSSGGTAHVGRRVRYVGQSRERACFGCQGCSAR